MLDDAVWTFVDTQESPVVIIVHHVPFTWTHIFCKINKGFWFGRNLLYAQSGQSDSTGCSHACAYCVIATTVTECRRTDSSKAEAGVFLVFCQGTRWSRLKPRLPRINYFIIFFIFIICEFLWFERILTSSKDLLDFEEISKASTDHVGQSSEECIQKY